MRCHVTCAEFVQIFTNVLVSIFSRVRVFIIERNDLFGINNLFIHVFQINGN